MIIISIFVIKINLNNQNNLSRLNKMIFSSKISIKKLKSVKELKRRFYFLIISERRASQASESLPEGFSPWMAKTRA